MKNRKFSCKIVLSEILGDSSARMSAVSDSALQSANRLRIFLFTRMRAPQLRLSMRRLVFQLAQWIRLEKNEKGERCLAQGVNLAKPLWFETQLFFRQIA
jgi:hypothetical protein